MKYNLKNNTLSIAVRCDSYQEALQLVSIYKMKFTDPIAQDLLDSITERRNEV